jgi:hypothetical protein
MRMNAHGRYLWTDALNCPSTLVSNCDVCRPLPHGVAKPSSQAYPCCCVGLQAWSLPVWRSLRASHTMR